MSTNAGVLNSYAFNAQPLVIRMADKKGRRKGRTGGGQRAFFPLAHHYLPLWVGKR